MLEMPQFLKKKSEIRLTKGLGFFTLVLVTSESLKVNFDDFLRTKRGAIMTDDDGFMDFAAAGFSDEDYDFDEDGFSPDDQDDYDDFDDDYDEDEFEDFPEDDDDFDEPFDDQEAEDGYTNRRRNFEDEIYRDDYDDEDDSDDNDDDDF